jgi:hypothetical protein
MPQPTATALDKAGRLFPAPCAHAAQRSAALEPSFGDETGHRQRARQLVQRPSQARERHRKRAGSLGPRQTPAAALARNSHTRTLTQPTRMHRHTPTHTRRRRRRARACTPGLVRASLAGDKQTNKTGTAMQHDPRAGSATGGAGLGSAAAAPRRVATTESLRPRRTSYNQCRPSVNMDTYV